MAARRVSDTYADTKGDAGDAFGGYTHMVDRKVSEPALVGVSHQLGPVAYCDDDVKQPASIQYSCMQKNVRYVFFASLKNYQ